MVTKIIMNICILLAAGTSSRFGLKTRKQMFILPDTQKTILETCIDNIIKTVDKIILVTNEDFYTKNRKIIVIPNVINCRLKSIEVGLDYVNKNYSLSTKNIIIHDVARPYITPQHIIDIIKKTDVYSQYCMKLTNGLIYEGTQCVDRDCYMELCTPICIKYKICKIICKDKVPCEFIDILNEMSLPFHLIPTSFRYIRKITTLDDINII